MKRLTMLNTTTRLLAGAALALSLAACKGGKGKTDGPGGGGGANAALDPTQASKAAKEDFEKVTNRYKSARSGGKLSGGDCERLAKDFEKVFKRHGKQMTVAYFNAGAIWEECGDMGKAEKIYKDIIKKVPKYDLAYNNLGVIYWNRKEESRALDYFKRAVKANTTTKAPRNNLAAALRNKYAASPQQGDFQKAERELQTVLAVDSTNRLAYENLARLYYDRGRLKDRSYLLLADLVVTQATRVLKEENIESADVYNLKGLIVIVKDNNQIDALRAFKKAAELEPRHADAHMNIAMISIRFRDYKQAEKSLLTALKDRRQKKNIEAYIGLGVAQRGLRKYKDAEAAFKKAREMKGSDPRALYNLGILYHDHIAASQENFSKKPYETAMSYFNKFSSAASSKKEYAKAVSDAKTRVGNIKQFFKDVEEMKKLEAEAKRLEAIQKKQDAEERKRLLDLEKRAREAAAKAGGAGTVVPKKK